MQFLEEEIIEIKKRRVMVIDDEPEIVYEEMEKRSLLKKIIGFLVGFGG